MKLKLKSALISVAILIVGCAYNPGEPSYDYTSSSDDKNKFVKVSGFVKEGIPVLLVLPQAVEICGVDGAKKSIAFNQVYLVPGEHTLCVRVNTGTRGPLLEGVYDKNIRFKIEHPNSYVIGFDAHFSGYTFSVKDSQGKEVPIKEIE